MLWINDYIQGMICPTTPTGSFLVITRLLPSKNEDMNFGKLTYYMLSDNESLVPAGIVWP